jgi:hypothetical protein
MRLEAIPKGVYMTDFGSTRYNDPEKLKQHTESGHIDILMTMSAF